MQGFLHRAAHHLLREFPLQRIYGDNPLQVFVFIQRFKGRVDQSALAVFVAYAPVKQVFTCFKFVDNIRLVKPNDGERIPVLFAVRAHRFHAGKGVGLHTVDGCRYEHNIVVVGVF